MHACMLIDACMLINTLEPRLLYLPRKRLEVTSSAIVVLTAVLDSPNLSKRRFEWAQRKVFLS